MKKYFQAVVIIIPLLMSTNNTKAQGNDKKTDENDKHKVVITGNVGASLVGLLFKGVANYANQNEAGVSLSQTPALQLSGDYYVNPNFSVGAAVSYQQFSLNFNHWKYFDELVKDYTIVDFNTKVSRTQIGARALFHFYNKKRIDMFSGIRLGPTIWKATTNSPDPNYEALGNFNTGSFGFQLIYFGLRGYITDNIGLNFELSVGSPYYASAGINARF